MGLPAGGLGLTSSVVVAVVEVEERVSFVGAATEMVSASPEASRVRFALEVAGGAFALRFGGIVVEVGVGVVARRLSRGNATRKSAKPSDATSDEPRNAV